MLPEERVVGRPVGVGVLDADEVRDAFATGAVRLDRGDDASALPDGGEHPDARDGGRLGHEDAA